MFLCNYKKDALVLYIYLDIYDGSVVYAWDIVDYPVKENYKEDQHALGKI